MKNHEFFYFGLHNMQCRADETNTIYSIVNKFFVNNATLVIVISSLLKKTRKTVFLGFSKLKLLKVIPYFQITYSHLSLRMKTTDKRRDTK